MQSNWNKNKIKLKPFWLVLLCGFMLSLTTLASSLEPVLNDSQNWALRSATPSVQIRIESVNRNGEQIEIVHLPSHETLELTTPVLEVSELVNSGLTQEELNLVREDARDVLELTLKSVLSSEFTGDMAITKTNEAIALQPENRTVLNQVSLFFKKIFYSSENQEARVSTPQKVSATFKATIQHMWQFIFVETYKAGVDYYRQFSKHRSRFTEFGIVLNLKLEPQIFISKFNPTQRIRMLSRSHALFLELSYSRTHKRLMVRTRYRREKGVGGLGLPAIKAEFKFFESDGTTHSYRGKSWYPVSPPIMSFVLDSSSHYFAQGITIGVNSGDLVPGSTLTNTFTEFVQTENVLRRGESVRTSGLAPAATTRASTQPPATSVRLSCRNLILSL